MGKRKHDDYARGNHAESPNAKRPATLKNGSDNALQTLRHHANDLAECLRTLESPSDSDLQRLASISRTLLPAFQSLSDNSTSTSTESNGGDSTVQSQAVIPSIQSRYIDGYIPPLESITKWTTSDIPQSLPPLPSIPDPDLLKAALTHPGMADGPSGLNYEVLEFLGDAFIYHVASELISQTFPNLSPGKCSQIREVLLRNATLSQYSEQYRLHRQAKFPEELLGDGRVGGTKASKDKRVKTMGDIFESYVGALIHSGSEGISNAITWLKPLWAMTIAKDIRDAEKVKAKLAARPDATDPLKFQQTFKQQLATMICVPAVKLIYKDVPNKQKDRLNLPLFAVAVSVQGYGEPEEFLGRGCGVSKKEAGEKAAEEALKNGAAMKKWAKKKQDHLAARAATAALVSL